MSHTEGEKDAMADELKSPEPFSLCIWHQRYDVRVDLASERVDPKAIEMFGGVQPNDVLVFCNALKVKSYVCLFGLEGTRG